MRVLDIDLDFFLCGREDFVDFDDGRLDAKDYPPWAIDDVIAFLMKRCQLTEPRPGFVAEHHNEIFYLWGDAIQAGEIMPPLEVVHLDAHSDLGLGDASYTYLIKELAFQPIEGRYAILKRRQPQSRPEMLDLETKAVTDGNWLMFAVACGWISDLICVNNSGAKSMAGRQPGDLLPHIMQNFDVHADHLHVIGTRDKALSPIVDPRPTVDSEDPPVPFTTNTWREFHAAAPFDVVCLTRSPPYTPPEADSIFDEIRERFIDESWGRR